MLKFIYEGKNYNYGSTGRQSYDVKTEIEMLEDADLTAIMEAIIKISAIATYPIHRESLLNCLNNALDNLGIK